MRRKDREVTDSNSLNRMLFACDTLRIGIMGDPYPYIVPVSFGMEVAEDRYCHGAISVDGEERNGPAGGVLGANGDFITLSDARLFEKYVEFLYICSQVAESEGLAVVVAERFLVPAPLYCLLEFPEIMLAQIVRIHVMWF